jgi:cyclomaltodextrinase / maltogenic alpha-amylase / neopullulanase
MPVAFTTAGGDAWTFDKLVEARVEPAACDLVTFGSEAGAVTTRPEGERVLARVPLQQGENRLEAECRKRGTRQGTAASQRWLVRLDDIPKARVRLRIDGPDVLLDGGASELAPARPEPLVAYEWRALSINPEPLSDMPANGPQIRLPAPRRDGEYLISLRVTDAEGRSDDSTTMLRVSNGRAAEVDLAREHAAWVDRAIIYGVVPPLFGPRHR